MQKWSAEMRSLLGPTSEVWMQGGQRRIQMRKLRWKPPILVIWLQVHSSSKKREGKTNYGLSCFSDRYPDPSHGYCWFDRRCYYGIYSSCCLRSCIALPLWTELRHHREQTQQKGPPGEGRTGSKKRYKCYKRLQEGAQLQWNPSPGRTCQTNNPWEVLPEPQQFSINTRPLFPASIWIVTKPLYSSMKLFT